MLEDEHREICFLDDHNDPTAKGDSSATASTTTTRSWQRDPRFWSYHNTRGMAAPEEMSDDSLES
jgi:hypothetical protein